MQKNSFWVYFLTGIALAGILIAMIFFMRLRRPAIPSVGAGFERSKGPVEAPIQIIEYSDFQCPACRGAQSTLNEMMTLHPDQIRLTYQHFPLEGHRWSPLAHQAAECAARQNRFWEYHDRLYSEQSQWSLAAQSPLEEFMRYARETGIDLDLFSRCLVDPSVNQKIREEKSSGSDLGVRSTPTFFVNGKMAVGTKPLQEEIERIRVGGR